jgi:hypothetical protein
METSSKTNERYGNSLEYYIKSVAIYFFDMVRPPGFESEITSQLLRTVSNFLKATAKE